MRKSLKETNEVDLQINAEDFHLFTLAVSEIRKIFGLLDWEIYTILDDPERGDSMRGWMQGNFEDRIATIGLSPDWSGSYLKNNFEIAKVAFHEVCELMLSDLGSLAERSVRKGIVDEETHKIIRKLENVVFPMLDLECLKEKSRSVRKPTKKGKKK